jgi:signal transduction histidine kinase/ActR/RegA family two-component response regulator
MTGTPDFRAVFEAVPGLYLVLARDLTIVAVSDAYLRATMTRREDIVGKGLFKVFPDNPDDPKADGVRNLAASLKRVIANHTADAMPVQKYDIRRPDGRFEERHWSPVNTPVLRDGKLEYIIHRVEDVTEFARLKQFGAEQSELVEHLSRLNQQLKAEGAERARAETRSAELEEQVRQSQKMEAVGRLAGGIAHDFNNLLSVIIGYGELVLMRMPPDAPFRAEIDEIRKSGERAAQLTRQLLAFSRKQVLQPEILNLNNAVANMDRMMRRLIGEDIDLFVKLDPDLNDVKFDPGQIEQIIMNLVVNARDAMPRGGKLTIQTANVHLDASYVAEHIDAREGDHVMIAISDTGVGMDAATRAKIFEPFFTTKELGRGTGLGLSTVFGIVNQSGGNIWVYSEPGRGTTFKVYLPVAHGTAGATRSSRMAAVPSRGTETILLVEDEESVRTLIRTILTQKGYNVLAANRPRAALETANSHAGAIDLLLTDVVMPEMGGSELARALTQRRPEVKVLYMSGYTDNAIVHHGVLDAGTAFLEKPIHPDTLLAKVRSVLNGSA